MQHVITCQMVHKKYLAGHKYHAQAADKAHSALKKQRKKNKNKYGFDQKEVQVRNHRVMLQYYLDQTEMQVRNYHVTSQCWTTSTGRKYTMLITV